MAVGARGSSVRWIAGSSDGDRDRHRGETEPRGGDDDVHVAQHAVRLGGDGEGVARFEQQFEDRAGDAPALLDRLVGIGIGAERDRARFIAGARQRGVEQFGGVGLGEQAAFEVHAGRQVVIGVGRPREAVDAAMLAPAIGIDRAVEADVGRAVAGQDRARFLDRHRGAPRGDPVELLDAVEPVAVDHPLLRLKRVGVVLRVAPRALVDSIGMTRRCACRENEARTNEASPGSRPG